MRTEAADGPATSGTLTGGRSSEGRISGYVFKVIREAIGQTQETLAERLGVGVATVQGWESGRRPLMAMSAGKLLALRAQLRRLGAKPGLLGRCLKHWKPTCSSAKPCPRRTTGPIPVNTCWAHGWSPARSLK